MLTNFCLYIFTISVQQFVLLETFQKARYCIHFLKLNIYFLQILDALQFLHHRGQVHLNLQPDNVIMVSRRRWDIKLIDFGRARYVTTYEGEKIPKDGTAEFMGTFPELLTFLKHAH